jgi:phosphoribosylformylglycinamidine cyclo-ligase
MTTPPASPSPLTYAASGVDTARADAALQSLRDWIEGTFAFNPVKPLLALGYFANVLPLTPELGLAISTDGVGTKILIAQHLGIYDTIGIDCVAMNANDVLCVGARPVAMVDYVAVEEAAPEFLAAIAKGLAAGARAAGISIPGGEIAQVRELVQGVRAGRGFELVGTCVGTVHPDRVLIGADVTPGDLVVGLASSGIHSNGLTLARRVLLEHAKLGLEDRVPELGRSLGEELLEPTRIYVPEVLRMLEAGLRISALVHLTGDGFLNLPRVAAPVGFVIDRPLPVPPIFALIQRHGQIADGEMFVTFNMGTGFCVVVHPDDAPAVEALAREGGGAAHVIGYAVADRSRRVWLPSRALVGHGKQFEPAEEPAPPYPAR